MTKKSVNNCGWASNDVKGAGEIDYKIDKEIHDVDHKADDGVGECDQKKCNDEVGES